jgi:hypothetical protein
VLLIPPHRIGFNEDTARDNRFQRNAPRASESKIRQDASREFDAFVEQLTAAGVQVVIPEISDDRETPDAVFPNNWISFHEDGTVILYPMRSNSRRLERRPEILGQLTLAGFAVGNIVDYSVWESEQLFLEGTGSLVLDRVNRLAFAGLSPRTSDVAVRRWSHAMGYQPIVFSAEHSVGGVRSAIYHTNVMMSIGETFCVVCPGSISNPIERSQVADALASTGREIIEIEQGQLDHYAGNLLQLSSDDGIPITVISETAHDSLNAQQRHALSRGCKLLVANIPTIEACGGGSVRCMIAEIFLPRSR